MARGVPHPPELKASVMAELAAGEMPSAIGKKYSIAKRQIYQWRAEGQRLAVVAPEKRAELGELVERHLRDTLDTLSFLARFARSEAWLERQNANDVAILYGVLADKAIRVLAAAEQNSDEQRTIDT